MRDISQFHTGKIKKIKYVLTDIDDTLTLNGRLPAIAYSAMELLQKASIKVVPITGRPAGWCDHIARMWPVDGVVGENGAFYFCYDNVLRKMVRRYFKDQKQREDDRTHLGQILESVLKSVPGAAPAADQFYRETDVAIDYCEDVKPMDMEQAKKIAAICESLGATAKISSIHVNAWFGNYSKLEMTKIMFKEVFNVDLDEIKADVVFAGDSPNDATMFGYFPNSVGVANVKDFIQLLSHEPGWITRNPGGVGFAELAQTVVSLYEN